MGRKLADFEPLWPAEARLVAEMGGARTVVIGPGVPAEDAARDLRLRASFLRFLALGGCEDCRPSEKGVQVRGGYVEGDGPEDVVGKFEKAEWEGRTTRGLDFGGCALKGDLDLIYCRIPDLVLLSGAKAESLSFSGSHLAGGIAGDGLEARGWVFLVDAEVSGEVRLPGAKLGGGLDCNGGTFRAEKDADGKSGAAIVADGLEARGGVFLRHARVTGEMRLPGAKLGGFLDCDGGRFQADNDAQGWKGRALNLDGMRVDGGFFLRSPANVDGVLDLTAAEVGHLNDAEASWPGPGLLVLDRFRYGAITDGPVDAARRLDWLRRQDPARWGADFWPQPYQQLAKVLREMGHEDEARTVLVAREHDRRAAELRRVAWWRKPAHWGFTQLLRMVGYGYRPTRALAPALAVVLLGWLVVDLAAEAGVLVPARAPVAGTPEVALVPLAYSFEAFVPIVKLGQVEAFRPDMARPWGYGVQVYLWLHGFAGWLIGGIAAAGVLGLFRRD